MENDFPPDLFRPDDRRAKYTILADYVRRNVINGTLAPGTRLPSINRLCGLYGISRDTVVKAYARLEEARVIDPAHGKGFFVSAVRPDGRGKVMLLFDGMAMFKEAIYREIVTGLKGKATVEVFFHGMDPDAALMQLRLRGMNYDWIGMIPPGRECTPEMKKQLADLEQEGRKIFLLDWAMKNADYPCAIQNFRRGIHDALMKNLPKVKTYRRIELITCPPDPIVRDIEAAFTDFCRETGIPGTKSEQVGAVAPGTLFIVISDEALALLIKAVRKQGLIPGRDLGILAYNDTPLKEIIGDGIGVITTDFRRIGSLFVEFVLHGAAEKHEIGTEIISRASF